MSDLAAASSKRTLRVRSKQPDYTEKLVGEDDFDGDEVDSSEPVRPVKKSRTSRTASEGMKQTSKEVPAHVARQGVVDATPAIGASFTARSHSPDDTEDSLPERVDDDDDLWELVEFEDQFGQDEFVDDEDDGEDEEFVPSIDDYVDEEELSSEAEAELQDDILDLATLRVHAIAVHGVDENFRRLLRGILLLLVAWASENMGQTRNLSHDQLAMTWGTASLLLHCDVDFVVNLFLSGIPLQVQQLFSKPSWCLDDFLSLPLIAPQDNRNGIYGNFATGNIPRSNHIGCEVYVGQSVKIWQRILQHLHMALKYVVSSLPPVVARALHYLCICRSGVKSNFRQLAAFDNGAESGYLMLLETVFMILLGTFQKHGYTHRFATQASFDLVEKIRRELRLPDVPWQGMNGAIPILQGFRRPSRKDSPCCNPDCESITTPHSRQRDVPLGSPRGWRILLDPIDPLGGYICSACAQYRTKHGVLPGAAQCRKMVAIRIIHQTRPKVDDPACADCGRKGSDDPSNNALSRYKMRWINEGPEKGFRCGSCSEYRRSHGTARPRTASGHLRTTKLHEQGEPCGHCQAPYTRGAGGGASHCRNTELQMMLCRLCRVFFSDNGELPDLRTMAMRRVRDLRKSGAIDQIVCSECPTTEAQRNCAKPHHVDKDGNIRCQPCYKHFMKR